MNPIAKHLAGARVELRQKTLHDIQIETAFKWAARAIAAKELGLDDDAHEYAHEALEHSALAEKEQVYLLVRRTLRKAGVSP